MKFKFKAQKAGGGTYEGKAEAKDKFVLYKDFKDKGETIVSAEPEKTGSSWFEKLLSSLKKGVATREKVVFAKNLGAMIGAGFSLSRALAVLEKQTANRKMKKIVSALDESVRIGKPLSEGLASFPQIFPPLFIAMVKTGEESGNLSASLQSVSDQLDKVYKLKKKITGALIYPAVVLSAMAGVGVLMMIYVVPSLTATFKDLKTELPMSTKFIIFVSDFMKNNIFLTLAIIAGAILACIIFQKSKTGKRFFDYCFLRVPVVGGIIKQTNTARTAITMSSLLSSGVDVVSSLQITGEVIQNSYFKDVLVKAEAVIKKGEQISTVFIANEKLYDPFFGEMVNVGEETGKLSEMLGNVGRFYEDEVDQKTKDISTIVEPFMIVLIGFAVGFFAISMISPMYSVMNNIN